MPRSRSFQISHGSLAGVQPCSTWWPAGAREGSSRDGIESTTMLRSAPMPSCQSPTQTGCTGRSERSDHDQVGIGGRPPKSCFGAHRGRGGAGRWPGRRHSPWPRRSGWSPSRRWRHGGGEGNVTAPRSAPAQGQAEPVTTLRQGRHPPFAPDRRNRPGAQPQRQPDRRRKEHPRNARREPCRAAQGWADP